MLIKYSCGCIGFQTEDKDFILKACDNTLEDNEYCLFSRCMKDKDSNPLDKKEEDDILKEIAMLIIDGYCYRKIKALLR